MTHEEALLYLPLENLTDLDDVYDDRLHDMRVFLLSHVPISLVTQAKIQLMRKIHEAYEFFAREEINDEFDRIEFIPYDAGNLFDLTVDYQRNLSRLRFRISRSESFLELIQIAEQALENMREYSACWDFANEEIPDDIRISRPEDEVELLIELEKLSKNGELRVEDIANLPLENIVRREAIRLSLWHKREAHEGAV